MDSETQSVNFISDIPKWAIQQIAHHFRKHAYSAVSLLTYGRTGPRAARQQNSPPASALRWMQEAEKNWIGSGDTPTAFALFPKDISSPRENGRSAFSTCSAGPRCRAEDTSPPSSSQSPWRTTCANSSDRSDIDLSESVQTSLLHGENFENARAQIWAPRRSDKPPRRARIRCYIGSHSDPQRPPGWT